MSPLLTLRRFEALAHGLLPQPLDMAVMVVGVAIAVGTKVIGSPNGTAFDAAVAPLLIAAFAVAARVGREAAQRRRRHSKNACDTSAIARLRLVYLGSAVFAATATVFVVMAPVFARFLEMLGA